MNLDHTHMAIPMSVAHRLLDCYYGSGPRNSGSVPATEVNPSSDTTPDVPPTGGVDALKGDEGRFFDPNAVTIGQVRPGWVAKGYGAPPAPKTNTRTDTKTEAAAGQ